ncbi:MAG: PqqD family peptide modification chaperone [Rhodospirillales bacterium]|nr:MAG: PqqD family peptide modification chaperone [Rhodospirillales bacterium]
MRLQFEQINQQVQIDDDDALLSPLPSVFRYWPYQEATASTSDEPVVTVRREGTGYRLFARWRDKPPRYSNPVNLACGLALNLNRAMLEQERSYLCLHGAGLQIGGRLVVLPNYYRAGKSALTVCLAAGGARVFSDDILPLLPDGSGMALGVSPRLRLPLPAGLGERTLRFIKRRRGAVNAQYLYVQLEPHEQARFGETSDFGGFVLLDRRESGPARLSPASSGQVLKQVVLRNFARQVPAETALDRLHDLVANSACYTLTYSNGDEAADLLMQRFTTGGTDVAKPADQREATALNSAPAAKVVPAGEYPRRRPGVRERLVDGDLFLVDGAGQAIYHLNPVGAGLWRLMDGSCGSDEVVSLLQEAFPDVEQGVIARDVATITADLLSRGLLYKGTDPAANCGN